MSSSIFDSIEHQARQYHYGGLVVPRQQQQQQQIQGQSQYGMIHQTHTYTVGAYHVSPTFSTNPYQNNVQHSIYRQEQLQQHLFYGNSGSMNQPSSSSSSYSNTTIGYRTIRHDNL